MESDVKIQCLSVMNVDYLVRTADEQSFRYSHTIKDALQLG